MQRGLPEYWWKENDLVKGKGNAVNGATDPWRDVGSGIRLDGKSTTSNPTYIEGLTEEEMLQMALAASMEPNTTSTQSSIVKLTVEPPTGTAGVATIQFRLPDGRRSVRRFLQSDPVGMMYAYVESESSGGGRAIELHAGFPRKDLQTLRNMTIAEANLSGEAVQCRFV